MKIKNLFLRKLAEEPEANTPASSEDTVGDEPANQTDGEPSVSAESSEEDLWGDMLDNSDDEGDAEPKAEEPSEPPKPEEPPAEEPPAVEPPKVEAPVEPSPQEAQTQPLNQEQVAVEAKRLRESALGELTNLYALTDDEKENLQVNPEVVLPRLAAQLHMNMIEALHFGIQQSLPQMIQQVTEVKQQQQDVVGKFYEAWPQLKNETYNDTVLRTMQVYKQLNPDAPIDRVISEGGAMAMAALKIPFQETAPPAQQQPQRQTPPPQPLAPGASHVSRSAAPVNEFEAIFEEAVNEGL